MVCDCLREDSPERRLFLVYNYNKTVSDISKTLAFIISEGYIHPVWRNACLSNITKGHFQFSVIRNPWLLLFSYTSFCGWFKKVAPSSQIIRCPPKTNPALATCIFLHLKYFGYFSLSSHWLLKIFSFLLVGLWLLCFWFLWHLFGKHFVLFVEAGWSVFQWDWRLHVYLN